MCVPVVSAAGNPIPKAFHLGKEVMLCCIPPPQIFGCSVLSQDNEM